MKTRRKGHHKRAAETHAARMLSNGGDLAGYVAKYGPKAGTLLYAADIRKLARLHRLGRD